MYIREKKTKNKKTGTVYVKHVLVENVRVDGEPRQRTVMQLGYLSLSKSKWKRLAEALESQITGQQCLLDASDEELVRLAEELVATASFSRRAKARAHAAAEGGGEMMPVDVSSIAATLHRTLGAEIVCDWAWSTLGFSKILLKCGLSPKDVSLARAAVFGRMVSPGSERQTYEWFRERSAMPEMPGANISSVGKDAFYEITNRLYDMKEKIEQLLYESERGIWPHSAGTVFLYDLTNTYMEGSCIGNTLANRGHCKSKRTDCPLITLALVVDGDGMPIASHIYKGNQSEPETLPGVVESLARMLWGGREPMFKPTFAMDRGIATDKNVDFLKANGYPYVVIRRGDEIEMYRAQFESGGTGFQEIGTSHRSAYGDECGVRVMKIDDDMDDGICKVLCISDGKAHKEDAIVCRRDAAFIEDIARLDAAIRTGRIKREGKINDRLERILARHKSSAAQYEAGILRGDRDDGIMGAYAQKKEGGPDPLHGCYVIETTHTQLGCEEIWKLYMTLTRVEGAFRSLKSDLGMRPVFHQKDDRSAAHLFIAVLAYHLLATIERTLREKGDRRRWETLRAVLSTHMRCTISMKGGDGELFLMRTSGRPEPRHVEIYERLGAKDPLQTITTRSDASCSK